MCAITKLKGTKEVETPAFWNNGELTDNITYPLANSPCEIVFHTQGFSREENVCHAFPEDKIIEKSDAETYAGLVYRDRKNTVIGHIFMMHEQSNVDWVLTEDILHMVAIIVGANIELANTDIKMIPLQMKKIAPTNQANICYYHA